MRPLKEPAIIGAAFSAFIAFLFMLSTVLTRLVVMSSETRFACLMRFKRSSNVIHDRSWYDRNLEDGVMIFTAIAASLTILGWAVNSQVDCDVSDYQKESNISHMSVACTPGEIPESAFQLAMITVLLMQLFWKV